MKGYDVMEVFSDKAVSGGMVDRPGIIAMLAYLKGHKKPHARADINEDFPMRGAVLCHDCDHLLMACRSKSKTGAKHHYYMCFKKGRKNYRKSIRRDVLESAFESLLTRKEPGEKLIAFARIMFQGVSGTS